MRYDPQYHGWLYAHPLMAVAHSSVMYLFGFDTSPPYLAHSMLLTFTVLVALNTIKKKIFPMFEPSVNRNVQEIMNSISNRHEQGVITGFASGMLISGILQVADKQPPFGKLIGLEAALYAVNGSLLITQAALLLFGCSAFNAEEAFTEAYNRRLEF